MASWKNCFVFQEFHSWIESDTLIIWETDALSLRYFFAMCFVMRHKVNQNINPDNQEVLCYNLLLHRRNKLTLPTWNYIRTWDMSAKFFPVFLFKSLSSERISGLRFPLFSTVITLVLSYLRPALFHFSSYFQNVSNQEILGHLWLLLMCISTRVFCKAKILLPNETYFDII